MPLAPMNFKDYIFCNREVYLLRQRIEEIPNNP